MQEDILKVLYAESEIQTAVKRLGQEISKDYAGKNPLMIGILKGAIVFMTDLIRTIDDFVEVDFMDVSSYGASTVSSGEVKILKDLDTSVAGRDIILVEDIVDSGRTLDYLIKLFKTRDAHSVAICALMDKPKGRVMEVKTNYVGLSVPDAFVVGYGLDYAEKYRNLPYIGILKPEVYEN